VWSIPIRCLIGGRSIQRWGAQVNFTDRYAEIPIREHRDEVRALLAATQ
jgi:hypothetical protein